MKKLVLIITFITFSFSIHANEIFEFDSNTVLQKNIKYGWHDVKSWKDFRNDLNENLIVFNEWENKKQSHLLNCLKSMVAPGWGHFSADQYLKGQVLLGLQILLAGSAYYFYDQSQDYYKRYREANQIDDINQYYIDANSSYRTSGILVSLWIITWGYTILDTIQATEKYNRNLWYTLYDDYMSNNVTFTAQGIQIRF